MKYIKVDWPEIQDYMMRQDFSEETYFDSRKNVWFVPSTWEEESIEESEPGTKEYFDLHDCYDAIEGDWEG